MKHVHVRFALCALMIFGGRLFAQEPKTEKGSMTKPADASQVKAALSFLAGSFTTEVRFPPSAMSPKEITGKGTSVIRWGLDSMFLILDDENQNALIGSYKAHGVLGYDIHEKTYILSMYNNFGDHPVYKGTFSGDTLVLVTKVPLPKASFDQKLEWYREGNNVRLKILNDMGKGYNLVTDQLAVPAHL